MAAETPQVYDFFNELYAYMKTWNSSGRAADGSINLDKVCPGPYGDCKKVLKLFYRAFDPLHREWFKTYFAQVTLNRDSAKGLLNCHYIKLRFKTKNIFIRFLYLCSFTYSFMNYCEENEIDGMLSQVTSFLKHEFLYSDNRLVAEGGFDALNMFCWTPNLPHFLEFIRHCYCEKALLHTFVSTEGFQDFGLHGRETLDILMSNVHSFETAVREAFEKDIYLNPDYKQLVDEAFLKLRLDLQNGPFQNFLSQDKANIDADITSPLTLV